MSGITNSRQSRLQQTSVNPTVVCSTKKQISNSRVCLLTQFSISYISLTCSIHLCIKVIKILLTFIFFLSVPPRGHRIVSSQSPVSLWVFRVALHIESQPTTDMSASCILSRAISSWSSQSISKFKFRFALLLLLARPPQGWAEPQSLPLAQPISPFVVDGINSFRLALLFSIH